MLELWRRVVIVSAVAVYITGLGCAGSLLVARLDARAGFTSLAAPMPGLGSGAEAGVGR